MFCWDKGHTNNHAPSLRKRLMQCDFGKFFMKGLAVTAPNYPALPYWSPLSVRVTCTAGFSPRVRPRSASSAVAKGSIVPRPLQGEAKTFTTLFIQKSWRNKLVAWNKILIPEVVKVSLKGQLLKFVLHLNVRFIAFCGSSFVSWEVKLTDTLLRAHVSVCVCVWG